MANKRAYELTQDPTLSFDTFIASDKSGYTEALGYSTETLLRTRATNSIDDSGNSSGTLTFADHNAIYLTIDSDYTATISGLTESTNYLYVVKGSDDYITLSGVNGTIDGQQIGATKLLFRITSLNGISLAEQINCQSGGSASSSDVSIDSGLITNFQWCNWQINNNVCVFSAKMTFFMEVGITENEYNITIDTFDVSLINDSEALWTCGETTSFNLNAKLTDNIITFYLYPAPTSGFAATVTFGGSFKIK